MTALAALERVMATLEPDYAGLFENTAAQFFRDHAPELLAALKDVEYLRWRIAEIMPLFQDARDAITVISETQRRMHGISFTLADDMDRAGTRTREEFDAIAARGGEDATHD